MSKFTAGNITVFGQETEFDGVLSFSDNLVVTGKFHGTIQASGNLEIEKTAVCDIDRMIANSIVVSGKITGDIEAKDRIELCAGSRVHGDLKAARLRISDGVEFEGKISMLKEIPSSDVFSAASDEYKNSLIMQSNEAR
ncbi:bactofilin family protein [Treponema sp.]|uniref:bactofilin family protein n=1 Tax=Treponema sp. TaxID=166 RepID=UPI003F06EC3C